MIILQKIAPDLADNSWARSRIARLLQQLHPCPYASLSHSGRYVIYYGDTIPVGVDIQRSRPLHSAFTSFVGDETEQGLYSPQELWSIKECCYKVCNDGYEPSDFKVLSRHGVRSKQHEYSVTTLPILDDYTIAFAILAT